MNVSDAVETRIEIREYADRPVSEPVRRAILEAARKSPSGKNLQHWHFLVVTEPDDLSKLAAESPTGGWVEGAAFAVVVCTDPEYPYHEIDAGRAITHMQLVAWEHDVGSCIYTGITDEGREYFGIPEDMDATSVVAFGYPTTDVQGKKDRKPLSAVVSEGRYGEPLDVE